MPRPKPTLDKMQALLLQDGPATAAEMAAALGVSYATINCALQRNDGRFIAVRYQPNHPGPAAPVWDVAGPGKREARRPAGMTPADKQRGFRERHNALCRARKQHARKGATATWLTGLAP